MSLTKWRPDTCECVVFYHYDQPTDTFTSVETPQTVHCALHRKQGGRHFHMVLDHCRRTNEILATEARRAGVDPAAYKRSWLDAREQSRAS